MSNVNNIPASHLKLDQVYEYSYKGSVTVGARDELPASMLEFSSTIKITGDSDQKFFIQVGLAVSVRECGAYPSCHGDKPGYTLDMLLVCRRANTERQATIHSHILSNQQFSVARLPLC